MHRTPLILGSLCYLLIAAGRADAERPNVVMVIADDQSYRDFGFMGNTIVHTPNLDQLAAESARYPNGYVPMSVCRPSLATLLTGLYPHQHGIHFNHPPPGLRTMREMSAADYRRTRGSTDYLIASVATLPRILAKHGYACLQTGKHWEGSYQTAGFTHGMTLGRPARRLGAVTGTRTQSNGERVAHGNGDAGLVIGRETMGPIDRFLEDHAGRQPFFLWYAPFLPHSPFDAPQQFRELYRDRQVPGHLLPYYAEIARFDATVGHLMRQLKKLDAWDNTLIVFVADNGFRPDPKRPQRQDDRSKLSPWEDGLRTPILVHWPGRVKPETHSQLVQTIDLVPTILSATGLADEQTRRMQGIDLLPSARGESPLPERPASGAIYPNDAATLGSPSAHVKWRWVRHGDFKLIAPRPDSEGSAQLYDLKHDPAESRNLAANPAHQQTLAELQGMLNRWWDGKDDTQVTKATDTIRILDLPGPSEPADEIDFANLPTISGEHAVINAARLGPHADPDAKIDMHHLRLNLHNYLARFGNRYWCIWSDGPKIEDWPTQEIKYATSEDGLHWSEAGSVTGTPAEPHAFIARGLWVRDGQLLALAARYRGKGAFGAPESKQLQLQAYRFEPSEERWKLHGTLYDNAINNFPPQKLPDSEQWILTRRDSRFNVSVLIGGHESFDQWESYPVVRTGEVQKFRPDEPIFWPLADGTLYALFRDNGGSQRLFQSISRDGGKRWETPRITNFPNATSKLFSLKTTTGHRVLILNANAKIGRRELHLAVSRDDRTFTRLARLAVPSPPTLHADVDHLQKKFQSGIASLQYPHAIENEGHLYIALSRGKVQIEVFRVRLHDIVRLSRQAANGQKPE